MNSLAERGGAPRGHRCAGRHDHHEERGTSRGFSLVELLITIVLAGIVFAALVPVFVSAQKASSGDKARNVATNIAQDRIEKIRLLGFDQIVDDASHLRSSTFAGGQFGSLLHACRLQQVVLGRPTRSTMCPAPEPSTTRE